ncbi:MAG: B12-binding domain-containing protein, partial [Bacillota bacterium]
MTEIRTLLDRVTAIVIDGLIEEAEGTTKDALAQGAEPLDIVEKGLVPGIEEAGARFARGDYFLPELVASA